MAYGMEWRKQKNDEHLNQHLRKILGRELYRSGIFVLWLTKNIVNLPFSISGFYKDLIISLRNDRQYKAKATFEISCKQFEDFWFCENEDEMNKCDSAMKILNKHGYIKCTADWTHDTLILEDPTIMQNLSETERDNIWKKMKIGSLPFNHISHLLSEEQRDHYLNEITTKLKTGELRDIALNGSPEFKQYKQVKVNLSNKETDGEVTRLEVDIDKDLALDSETDKAVDVEVVEDSNSKLVSTITDELIEYASESDILKLHKHHLHELTDSQRYLVESKYDLINNREQSI
jgi:hypothetical protein